MTTLNDDLIRTFLADEARRALAAAPTLHEAVGRLAPRIAGPPTDASQRLIVLLAATLLLVAALGTAIAVGSGLLRLPLVIDDPTDHSTQARLEDRERFSMLNGEVTFHGAPPWGDHPEAHIDSRVFFLIGPGHTAAVGTPQTPQAEMTIFVNPLAPEEGCGSISVPPSAEALAQAIRSNPALETTAPVTGRVGRLDALQLDVVAAPGASIGPCSAAHTDVVYVPGRPWGGVGPGDLARLYLLDLPGGSARSLAILITAPNADLFQQAIDTAAPILESFEFDAP